MKISFSSRHGGVSQFHLDRLERIRSTDLLKIGQALDTVRVPEQMRPDIQTRPPAVAGEDTIHR